MNFDRFVKLRFDFITKLHENKQKFISIFIK